MAFPTRPSIIDNAMAGSRESINDPGNDGIAGMIRNNIFATSLLQTFKFLIFNKMIYSLVKNLFYFISFFPFIFYIANVFMLYCIDFFLLFLVLQMFYVALYRLCLSR